ncbi:hypothetical protein SO802_030639 [Lithocarpus litseifolius]|uniref:Uncharacterized protein n=1 Tax=Lithocarpus litseifolius TaxID=425828 RepID=A0AAW2BJF7_9ROSI
MVANQSKVTFFLNWLRLSKFIHLQIMCQLIEFIAGGKVSITCMDDRSRVVYYGSDATDKLGQFDIIVNKYINGKELKVKLCSVRLVSSPDSTCNILIDFAGGKRGVKLNLPSLVYRDQIKYTLGPFYFTNPFVMNLIPLILMTLMEATIDISKLKYIVLSLLFCCVFLSFSKSLYIFYSLVS